MKLASEKIQKVLKRIDFLHTDNQRDYNIAKQLGFKGKHVGVIPGGGGYNLDLMRKKTSGSIGKTILMTAIP